MEAVRKVHHITSTREKTMASKTAEKTSSPSKVCKVCGKPMGVKIRSNDNIAHTECINWGEKRLFRNMKDLAKELATFGD